MIKSVKIYSLNKYAGLKLIVFLEALIHVFTINKLALRIA